MGNNLPSHVVVGGGIAGMICALLLSERGDSSVTLIEREASLGGLLGRLDYGDLGSFDLGMHNLYETGICELDDLIFNLLPESEWQILEGNQRDLAGSWFDGRLQLNSPYPDLRDRPGYRTRTYIEEIFDAAKKGTITADGAVGESIRLFGQTVTNEVIMPILFAQFRTDPHLLHRSALWLSNIHRVLLLDEGEFMTVADMPGIRERIAFPEQRTLPPAWASGRRAFYPKKFGIHHVVDAITARLRSAGTRILTSAQPKRLGISNGGVDTVLVDHGGNATEWIRSDSLYWSANSTVLARLLGIETSVLPFDRARPTWVVSLLLRDRPRMGDLYYFFNYSPEFETFRVTNYSAYCEGAPRNGQFPVAVELLLEDRVSPTAVAAKAVEELARFSVIAGAGDVTFAAAEQLSSGIPLLSLANFHYLSEINTEIENLGCQNLTTLGMKVHRDIFFQRDVLVDLWHLIMGQSE